jgi:hypothetical protein
VTVNFKWEVVFECPRWYSVRLCLYLCFPVVAPINYFRINDFRKLLEPFLAIRRVVMWLKMGINEIWIPFFIEDMFTIPIKLFIINGEGVVFKTIQSEIF